MKKILLFLISLSFWMPSAFAVAGSNEKPLQIVNATSNPDDLRDSFSVAFTGKSLVVALFPPTAMSGKASLMNIVGQVFEEWTVEFEQGGTQNKKLTFYKTHTPGIYIFTMQIDGRTLSRRVII